MSKMRWSLLLFLSARSGAQRFGCTQTVDTKSRGLKVLQTSTTNEDFCSNMETTDSVGELVDSCSAFCGNGNIPLLVGIPSYGFSHADIDTVCLADEDSLAQYNPTKMNDCRTWSQALRLINTRAAALVAALDNMTMAQLNFKTGIATKSKELAATMSSEEVKNRLLGATQSQVIPEYRSILEAGVEDFLSNGKFRRDLQDTMEVLRGAGRNLDAVLTTNLPQLTKFVEQCGDLLVSTGPSKEYLLDICIQRGAVCLDNAEAQHIGCCCSTIPLGGTFGITGETGGDQANNSRRLQMTEGPVDVCAEADVLFGPEQTRRQTELQATDDGTALLEAHLTALKAAYPDYFSASNCRSRRLSAEEIEVQTEATQPGNRLKAEVLPHAAPRNLKLDGLTCSPPTATQGDTSYKAAFWAQTEENYCIDIPPDTGSASEAMTDQGLADICKSFCGDDAVPLTIGAINFGFNQTTMDDICLAGDILEANSSFVEMCHGHATAMQNVQSKLAAFVASLNVLEAEKTLYEANAKKAAADLKAAIEARATDVLQDALVNEKIVKLKELLIQETASMKTSGTAYLAIKQAVQDVELKGNALKTTLSESLGALDTLVTDCNKLFTGLGASNEYLLDICTQTSNACVDVDMGRHVGCCCGYSPLIALGSATVPTATIDGISATRFSSDATGATRTAARRLATAPYSVCGEAYTSSKPKVEEAHAKVRLLGQEELINQHLIIMARRYPDQFGCHFPGCMADTGGTCSLFECDSTRGPVDCVNGKCICKQGYCANPNGVCVSVSEFIQNDGFVGVSFSQPLAPSFQLYFVYSLLMLLVAPMWRR
mmetsp:Transcript_87925/g.179605  ORF Transcript_87925/g.179605 Transcript_87925/m.179605 type:complete len:829 (+) Transcript_87925:46-2532(+)